MWFLLALLPPLFWALSNVADQYLVRFHFSSSTWGFYTLANLAIVPLAFLYPLFFEAPLPSLQGFGLTVLAALLMELCLWPYMLAIKHYQVENVLPAFQLIPVFTAVLAYVLLGQTLSIWASLGIVCVALGAGLFCCKGNVRALLAEPKGIALISVSAFGYGFYTLYLNHLSEKLGEAATSYGLILGWSVIGLTLFAAMPKARKEVVQTLTRTKGRAFGLSMIQSWADVGATIALVKALALAPAAAFVTAVNGLQPVLIVVLAFLCSKIFVGKFAFTDTKRDVVLRFAFTPLIILGLWLLAL